MRVMAGISEVLAGRMATVMRRTAYQTENARALGPGAVFIGALR
jgi:hypothetical protein